MRQVTEDEHGKVILSLAKPNPGGFPRVIPDAPDKVYMRGATQVADYLHAGRVVARHESRMGQGSKFFIE